MGTYRDQRFSSTTTRLRGLWLLWSPHSALAPPPARHYVKKSDVFAIQLPSTERLPLRVHPVPESIPLFDMILRYPGMPLPCGKGSQGLKGLLKTFLSRVPSPPRNVCKNLDVLPAQLLPSVFSPPSAHPRSESNTIFNVVLRHARMALTVNKRTERAQTFLELVGH
jgi:hypothetical protein